MSDINECSSSPCKNGGECTDHVNKYTCTCTVGHNGADCVTMKFSFNRFSYHFALSHDRKAIATVLR